MAAVFTAPLRRFLEAGLGYSSKDVEWEPGIPYRCASASPALACLPACLPAYMHYQCAFGAAASASSATFALA